MNTPFTIAFNGGAQQTFDSCGLAKPVLSLSSAKESTLRFSAAGTAMDADALAAEKQPVTVYYNGQPFFTGRLFRIPRSGSGSQEAVEYEVRDPWWDFQRCVYQQEWYEGTNSDGDISYYFLAEYVLGMNAQGVGLTNGGTIADAVSYAISCGANCQLGTIGVSAPISYDAKKNMTVGKIIQEMLHWSPDAVAWFDHSKQPPAFNVTRIGDCAKLNLPFIGAVEKQNIHAMPELAVPVVALEYIQSNTSNDGPSQIEVTYDIFPGNFNPGLQPLDAIVEAIRLAGAISTYQRQPVTTTPMPAVSSADEEGGPADDPTILWWQRKAPWLQNLGTPGTYDQSDIGNQLVITNVYGVYQMGQGNDDGSGNIAVNPIADGYPNELLSGTVADWMDVVWAGTNWSALVKYSYPDVQNNYTDQDWDAVNVFGPDDGSGFSAPCLVTTAAMLTSAITQTYTDLTGETSAEPAPIGLAQYLYETCSILFYEGNYTSVAQDCAPAALGVVLNLTGGRTEWAGMNALVQEIEQDLETGKTTYRFGAYGHLTIQDLLERIRAARRHTTAKYAHERVTGASADDTPVDGGVGTPGGGGGSPPSIPSPPWIGSIPDYTDGVGNPLTWDGLLGFGQSTIADSRNAAPLERLEISVGNDEANWPDDVSSQMSNLDNVLSVVSG
ncbi:MAG TPA: hypothetical protein VHY22_03680, partial [Chthoniobacteraceae bacterium]|nr:hypothetical protein [Chthoniobacteraceae bacterium]